MPQLRDLLTNDQRAKLGRFKASLIPSQPCRMCRETKQDQQCEQCRLKASLEKSRRYGVTYGVSKINPTKFIQTSSV